MKKKKDAALEYMKKLDIFPAKSPSGAVEQLRQVMDPAELTAVLTAEETGEDPQAFYRVKNRTLETALTVSGAFGGDVLRKACAYLDGREELREGAACAEQGQNSGSGAFRILESGCDCGIVTCFLAERLPGAEVSGADLSEQGIAAARQLAERLQLSNVTFLAGTPEAYPAGTADAVISLRTMHENCDVPEPEEGDGRDASQAEQCAEQYAAACAEALFPYAAQIAGALKSGGCLYSIERQSGLLLPDGQDALIAGWVRALERAGLRELPEERKELLCMEVGQESRLQAIAAEKTE